MGEFVPAALKMDKDEKPVFMTLQDSFREGYNYVFIFENGKGVRVPEKAYETSSVRRKLKGVFSTASPIVAVFSENEKKPFEIMLVSNDDRAIIIKSSLIPIKTTKTSVGIQLMTLKKGQTLVSATDAFDADSEKTKGYRKLKLPATGVLLSDKDLKNRQISIDDVDK
jgi:DNA gyrase subunit A